MWFFVFLFFKNRRMKWKKDHNIAKLNGPGTLEQLEMSDQVSIISTLGRKNYKESSLDDESDDDCIKRKRLYVENYESLDVIKNSNFDLIHTNKNDIYGINNSLKTHVNNSNKHFENVNDEEGEDDDEHSEDNLDKNETNQKLHADKTCLNNMNLFAQNKHLWSSNLLNNRTAQFPSLTTNFLKKFS